MSAAEIRDALEQNWKPSEYLVLHECAEDAMRMGRKIDTLVVSLWKSRGYELDAIEIKISISDWLREVNNPAKADFWWAHSHRFHVAVPVEIADRVRETLPTGWGLLAVNEGTVKAVVKAAKHPAEPLPWPAIVGVMRGASGAGANALIRAGEKGREEGYRRGKADAERNAGDEFLRAQAKESKENLTAFCEAAGIDPRDLRLNAEQNGKLWAVMRDYRMDPLRKAQQLHQLAAQMEVHAASVRELGSQLVAAGSLVEADPDPTPKTESGEN